MIPAAATADLAPSGESRRRHRNRHRVPTTGRAGTTRRAGLRVLLASALAFGMVLAGGASPAAAHGAATRPGSRTYLCRIDGTHASGDIQPSNQACAAAVEMGGKQPLWDWFGVLRGDGGGRTRGYIPDGQLCSGGEPKYAGYDLPRDDWPYTRLTAGADMTVRYNAWAAHPGDFRLYVTKDGYDPTRPLRWDDLEDAPFSVWDQNAPNGTDEQNGSADYQWKVTLPDKTGAHIIYSVWTRSDSQETFYGCSDVRFDGGNGEVVGIGAGANPVGAPQGGPAPVTQAAASATAATPTSMAPAATDGAATDGADQQAAGAAAATQAGMDPAGAGAGGTDGGVAGTAAATDGAAASGSETRTSDDLTMIGQAASVGDAAMVTPVGSVVEVDPATLGPAPATVAHAAGLQPGTNWVAIVATAVAGLAVGVMLSMVAWSSPRARRFYRRLIGDEPSPLVINRANPTPPGTSIS